MSSSFLPPRLSKRPLFSCPAQRRRAEGWVSMYGWLGQLRITVSPPGSELATFRTNQQVAFTPRLWQTNLGKRKKEIRVLLDQSAKPAELWEGGQTSLSVDLSTPGTK